MAQKLQPRAFYERISPVNTEKSYAIQKLNTVINIKVNYSLFMLYPNLLNPKLGNNFFEVLIDFFTVHTG